MPARTKIDPARVKQLLDQGVAPKYIAIRLGCSLAGLCTAIAKMRREGVL